MRENLVNLNVNPCKMCMPMGSVTAFLGIAKCMTILHGSQGCSTYIRRHMATHYNEPVDIASSSLTEQGTVFGGEKNLIKGIENLISMYHPEVIGVATTCLAETIGEDVPRIIRDFYDTHPDCGVKIFTVSSSGYSGTQFEGFFAALFAIVSQTEMDGEKNNSINIVTGMLSPADTRFLKQLVKDMGLHAIFLPDLSENLDSGHEAEYERLKKGGTPLHKIRRMAGARMTIELTTFADEKHSPARYLFDTYGVPYVRLNIPVGLAGTDDFIKALLAAGGTMTEALKKERARYLDAMVDSHKYNSQGRAVVYGEPDFVYSACKLCMENGILPVVASTGARCEALVKRLKDDIAKLADSYFVEGFKVADDCDFDSIETLAKAYGANVMIGSSDGRRIAHKLNIPLVRCAFPIHDQVGGQRVRTLGYEGSLALLDMVTNELLLKTETHYREELYGKYYQKDPASVKTPAPLPLPPATAIKTASERTATHPCFNGCGGKFARMHLPVARDCNIQCNYCLRKYDCPNESRPGVTTAVLTPKEAAAKYLETKKDMENLTVVGIAGPGDALADFETTRETLELLRKADPDITVCLSTNGLMLPQYADALAALNVSHITVTVNAVDPVIGSKIYQHVRYMGHTYTGVEAASILLANQLAGIKMMADRGAVVKVNIVMLKGINDHHIRAVVEKAKSLGASITNIMQHIPVKGSAFEHMAMTTHQEIMKTRMVCGEVMPQMFHCRQCRADAVGTLNQEDASGECAKTCSLPSAAVDVAPAGPMETALPQIFAVSSKSGVLVDQHFGHATDFYIYECRGSDVRFKERRGIGGPHYCGGKCNDSGEAAEDTDSKMARILSAVADCDCIVTMRIGETPRMKLEDEGKRIYTVFGPIEQAVHEAAQAM